MNTIILNKSAFVKGFAASVGPLEKEGKYGKYFDTFFKDPLLGEDTWEKAESKLQKSAIDNSIKKAGLNNKDIDLIVAGDLLNQCTASTFSNINTNTSYLGVYGACSTMALSIGVASLIISGGFKTNVVAATSSHFCTAERQYRFPLEYGGQKAPSAQHTVTGAGSLVITSKPTNIEIKSITFGKIVDMGITDATNMGAAMAPAAADTISAFFSNTNTTPCDYDALFTGDLGEVGSDLLVKLLKKTNIDITPIYDDCGLMIYDRENQDVDAGGSGCGCSASILCGYILNMMQKNELKNVLFCATGSLQSPTSANQNMSIPGIAHLINFKVI